MRYFRHLAPAFFLLAACGGNTSTTDGGGGPDLAAAPDLARSCMHAVKCTDEQIQTLDLKKTVSTRVVENMADGSGWATRVDATGGGFTPTESFVYAKFTDTGLMRVAVSDEGAFSSADWDIAFRRFIVRLNSGVSGPSCVTGALIENATYDGLTTTPMGTQLAEEAYFDGQCKLEPDASGLGSPATVTSEFWQYENCVKMTGNVYIIKLASGRSVKLMITSYYTPVTAQDTCNSTGGLPMGASGGQLRMRWAFLAG